jgi:hypothetical protein
MIDVAIIMISIMKTELMVAEIAIIIESMTSITNKWPAISMPANKYSGVHA